MPISRYHPNTLRLITIEDEAIRLGWYKYYPKLCFSSEVAKRAGEEGELYPSDNAIVIASKMLNKLKKVIVDGKN